MFSSMVRFRCLCSFGEGLFLLVKCMLVFSSVLIIVWLFGCVKNVVMELVILVLMFGSMCRIGVGMLCMNFSWFS